MQSMQQIEEQNILDQVEREKLKEKVKHLEQLNEELLLQNEILQQQDVSQHTGNTPTSIGINRRPNSGRDISIIDSRRDISDNNFTRKSQEYFPPKRHELTNLKSTLQQCQKDKQRHKLLQLQQEFRKEPKVKNDKSLRCWRDLGAFNIVELVDQQKLSFEAELSVS